MCLLWPAVMRLVLIQDSLNARCTSYIVFLGLRGNLNPTRSFAKFEESTIRY